MSHALATLALLIFSDLLMLGSQPLGPGLPAGWMVRTIRGQPDPAYSIRETADGRAFRLEGQGSAAWLYHPLPASITAGASMSWTWRVLQAPATADLRRKQLDDSPIRVFVVFGRWEDLGRSAHAIFYTWGNAEDAGLETLSHVSRRIAIVRMAGAAETGDTWREVRVRPFEDYARIFGSGASPITTVGLMQDTDQTREAAVAEIRDLYLLEDSI